MKLKPRYYQIEAFESIIGYICRNEKMHPLVALPTGTGKSLVIAMLIEYARREWNINVLVLSHTEDILKQDYDSVKSLIDEPIGLYSAGLDSKTILPVTIAGIQSVFRKPELFVQFDFVIIDEAHLINLQDETMYKKFLGMVGQVYCGLTATPYRLKDGYIYGQKHSLFNDLVCDYTTLGRFNKLIEDGYLSPLKTLQTQLEFETDKLHKRGGDFIEKEMSLAFDKEEITNAAVDEIIEIGIKRDYKKWLIFAIDINHAEHIAERLIQKGISTGLVHSKMTFDKQTTLEKHKNGIYRALVNVNMLTTGYNDPSIDLIGMLRPTDSPVLHVQTAGRGTRIYEGKSHCLFLDFAGNTKRLGAINNIQIRSKKKLKDGTGAMITKTCPECSLIVAPAVKFCECGYEFQFTTRLENKIFNGDIIETGAPKWYNVVNVMYQLKHKNNMPDTIQVLYVCGVKVFTELWCLDHKGYARQRAVNIMRSRAELNKADLVSCQTAYKVLDRLKIPKKILVSTLKKYPEILKYEY